jgi:cysteine desulfurase
MAEPPLAYLDNAASTPVRTEVVEAMMPYLTECYGNPTGAHRLARDSRRAIDDARDVLASGLGCESAEIVFCGGGSEADNLAVFGAQAAHGGSVACSTIEHAAVLEPVKKLGGRLLPVTPDGVVDIDALENHIDSEVSLVSVMAVNNETGMIQPVAEIVEKVRELAPEALIHTDAVQGFPWLDLTEMVRGVDLISLSAHKFGGPKGVGALAVRSPARVEARLIGGGQEHELRSGTQNVSGIVAMGVAAQLTLQERSATVPRISALRDQLADGLLGKVPDAAETGDRSRKIAGSCHLCFEGIESEALLFMLERGGVFASAASSCSSGGQDPSHVLAAMGYSRELAGGSLRLSLGPSTTEQAVEAALDIIPDAVEQLRAFSI